jgi:hypothetical protein
MMMRFKDSPERCPRAVRARIGQQVYAALRIMTRC